MAQSRSSASHSISIPTREDMTRDDRAQRVTSQSSSESLRISHIHHLGVAQRVAHHHRHAASASRQ